MLLREMQAIPKLFVFSLLATLSFSIASLAQVSSITPQMDRTEYGDWIVECFSGSSRPEDCQLYQKVTTSNGEFVAMIVTFAWSAESGALETELALPLGVLLSFPPMLTIGPDYKAQLAWSRCTSDGCLVEGTTNSTILNLLQTSDAASITVMHPTDGEVTIPVSLSGFNDAVTKIIQR